MSEKIELNLAWCPLCDQGWVKIVKERNTKQLYACCSECETQWKNPEEGIKETNCLPFNTFGDYINPTYQEVREKGWDKYILNREV